MRKKIALASTLALTLSLALSGRVLFASEPAETNLSASSPEQAKSLIDKVWKESGSEKSLLPVYAGASKKIITPATDGKPWGEPFTSSRKSGKYVIGDPCEDLNGNGKCDQLFFGGYFNFKHVKQNKWELFRKGLRRHPELYNTPDGVHDDLYARAMVLKIGGKKIGFVTVDAVGLFYADTLKIRRMVKDRGFDLVIVQATHNHSGPDTMGLFGPVSTPWLPKAALDLARGKDPLHVVDGKHPKFMSYIYEQSAKALIEADQKTQSARLYFGKAAVPDFDGKNVILDNRDPQVWDREVHTLQARDLFNRPIATLANFGIHPESFYIRITKMSADISGSLAAQLETQGGVGLHSNAALGGIEGNDMYGYDDPKASLSVPEELKLRWKGIEKIGEMISKASLDSARSGKPAQIGKVGIVTRKIFIPVDNQFFLSLSKQGALNLPRYTNGAPDPNGQDILTEMNLIVLQDPKGEPIAEIFTVPGELLPEIYLGGFLPPEKAANPLAPKTPILKNYLRAPNQFLMGLGNDELGYVVPLNDFLFPSRRHSFMAQKDKFGRKHSLETKSASSQLSQIVAYNLIGMLEEYYEGKTQWTPEAAALQARKDALAAFSKQREAIPSLVQLYLHEPPDEATKQARKTLLKMNYQDVVGQLSKSSPSDEKQKETINKLLWDLRAR